jgi:hypothetical protein
MTLIEIDIAGLAEAMCEPCATSLVDAAFGALMSDRVLAPALCPEDDQLWRAHCMARYEAGR